MEENNEISLAQKACRLFIHTDRLHWKAIERNVADLGIHRSQHFVLMRIARVGDGASQKAIADDMEISPAALAVTLKKLEAGGYIVRKTSKEDSRFNRVSLTDKGREIIRVSEEIFARVDEETFRGLSPEEISLFISCLEKMQENLKKN